MSGYHGGKISRSRQLSVIPGARITRCSHTERKDLDAAQEAKSSSVFKCLPLEFQQVGTCREAGG